jgi:cyclopropane-fatty-acyl-phospholipid synthase
VSTQNEVEVSYDVSNEFFRLWLDRDMSYTCALFEGTDDLEEAQLKKLDWHHQAARVTPDKRVLDIGCGWGANLEHLCRRKGVRQATGITLSRAQGAEIERRQIPGLSLTVGDYRDFNPAERFDAVISICMMEHIATPAQARAGEHLELYRDYFRRVHRWTTPGSWFGLQTILRDRVPRDPDDLRDVAWVTTDIFPGGISLRLEDVVRSVSPYWEIMEVRLRREHYQRTCQIWRERLLAHEGQVRRTWGDRVFEDYDRYLRTCVRSFERHYQSLAQFSLRRIDGPDEIGHAKERP